VVDLRTGARSTWRGGMERDGQTFGIEDLSWTGNGESLAYRGAWCPPDGISYSIYGDFVCSSLGSRPYKASIALHGQILFAFTAGLHRASFPGSRQLSLSCRNLHLPMTRRAAVSFEAGMR
jgi:hypothetical protein